MNYHSQNKQELKPLPSIFSKVGHDGFYWPGVISAVVLALNLTLVKVLAVNCDIITSASAKVTRIVTTYTTAAISWTEGHSNGERYFCYDTSPPLTCPKLAASRKTTKIEVMENLIPRTKYYYRFYGVWGRFRSNSTGSFTTDSSTCLELTKSQIVGFVMDASGDSLEHVVVNLTKTTTGEVYSSDTTNRSGGYFLRVIPGTYYMSLTYPPFTSPKPDSITIISGKSFWPSVKKLTGAFQVGGYVIVPPRDSIGGATVTAVSTTDPAITFSTLTDVEGHYNIGLKPGTYTLTANYQGKKLPVPLPIKVVDQSLKIPELLLSATASLGRNTSKRILSLRANSGRTEYLVNGARKNEKKPQAKSRFFSD